MHPAPELIDEIRAASRQMVRELGFMNETLANTQYSPSAVHSLIEIGERGPLTATQLAQRLGLEKSSVSRMLRKLILCGEIAETSTHSDARSKHLRLTGQGENTLAAIHRFARQRVRLALEKLPQPSRKLSGKASPATPMHYDQIPAMRCHPLKTGLSLQRATGRVLSGGLSKCMPTITPAKQTSDNTSKAWSPATWRTWSRA